MPRNGSGFQNRAREPDHSSQLTVSWHSHPSDTSLRYETRAKLVQRTGGSTRMIVREPQGGGSKW